MNYKEMISEALKFHDVPENTIQHVIDVAETAVRHGFMDGKQEGIEVTMKAVEENRKKYKTI